MIDRRTTTRLYETVQARGIRLRMAMHEDDRTDRIAREAARLLAAGKVQSMESAIRRAAEALRLHGAAPPTPGRVRRHAQAMSLQSMGDAAYSQSVRDVLRIAEEIMTLLAELTTGDSARGSGRGVECLLVGRGARGLVDADPTLHIRAYTDLPIGRLADTLVQQGYEEPEFQTIETTSGRLNRLMFDEGGVAVVVTRCAPSMIRAAHLDLYSGNRIATMDLEELRSRLKAET